MSEKQQKAVANDTVQTTTYRRDNPCGCPTQAPSDGQHMRPPPVADKGSIALSEI